MQNQLFQTHLNQTIIALSATSMFQSLGFLPHAGLLGTWQTLTVHRLLMNLPVYQNFHLLKFRRICVTVLTAQDKQSPPSLRKAKNHNTTPWYESIRNEPLMANRERRQAYRILGSTKLTISKDLYRQTKHKVSKLEHTAK